MDFLTDWRETIDFRRLRAFRLDRTRTPGHPREAITMPR